MSTTHNADTVTVWRNPTDLTGVAGSVADGSITGKNFFNPVDTLRLADFAGDNRFAFDAFRVGESWEDAVVLIPEPSSVSAAVLGLCLLGRRRR